MSENITMRKEFYEPLTELKWDTEGVTQAGATRTLVYRDKNSGTYCRILRFPEGFGEGKTQEEADHACCDHDDFDEMVYVATGGVINRRLHYTYLPGSIAFFPIKVNHGPLEAPFGCLLVEFRHFVHRPDPTEKTTTKKEFLQPATDMKWSTEGVTQAGAEAALVYRDVQGNGSYCRVLRLPEGFCGGKTEEEIKKPWCNDDVEEITYIISGGLINKRLGYRYHPGTIAVFQKGTSYGPFEAPVGAMLLQFRHYRPDVKR